MKTKLLPLILCAMMLAGCTLPTGKRTSSSSEETTVSTTDEGTTGEGTTEEGTTGEDTSEEGSSEEGSSASEEKTSEGGETSSEETSSSEEGDNIIRITIPEYEGTIGVPITSFGAYGSISGANIASSKVTSIFQSDKGGIRFGSRSSAGSLSITFTKNYAIKRIVLDVGTLSSNAVEATVSFGESKETVEVPVLREEVSTVDLASSGETLTISGERNQVFFLFGITLYVGEPDPVYPTAIELSPSDFHLAVGNTRPLNIEYTPYNTNIKEVSFSSSDSSIASVDSSGLVTANSVGKATITATASAEEGQITAIAAVEVTEEVVLDVTHLEQTVADYSANNVYNIDSCPTLGEVHPLLIPVWFTDSSTYITTDAKKQAVHDDIEKAYFGTESETGWHSVKTFYEEESQGLISIDGVTTDWYECGQPSTSYYRGGTESLVESAVEWYFSLPDAEPRSQFDSDQNGYIDAVLLIYGAPDYMSMRSSASNLWAYCYWLQDYSYKNVRSPGPNTFFWASYDFMYSSETAKTRAGSSYGGGDTRYCNIDAHTFIHEMGHVFGLMDYYDYGPYGYCPAGGFSMQDYNVGGHDPFSTMQYGWTDPYIPTESCTISLKPFQDNHDLILLTPEWNEYDSPFDEYLLLEFYTPTGLNEFDSTHRYSGGYPTGANVPGIRVWHVDGRLVYINESSGNWPVYSEDNLTSDATIKCKYGVERAFTNTYGDEDYGSPLGAEFYDYNELQLIRNSSTETYHSSSAFSARDLFCDGDSFAMENFSKQFVKEEQLNSGVDLGWEFTVEIQGSGDNVTAVITLERV